VGDRSFGQDPEIRGVAVAYKAAVARFAPSLAGDATSLLERVLTPNWTLEWMLSRWLGQSLDLTADQVSALTLSNAYGLTSVRLLDDLVDGEAGDVAAATGLLLPTALYHLWVQQYRQMFVEQSEFWPYLDRYLAQWITATHAATEPPSKAFASYGDEDFRRLAHRGAPLKLCAVGACLMAGRQSLIEPMTACLDQVLAAAVLLDQVKDWAVDLAAFRYNLFVAYATPRPQTLANEMDNRNAVLKEIGTGGTAAYFDVLLSRLVQAQSLCAELESPPLALYIQDYQDQVNLVQEQLDSAVKERLSEITDLLFGG